MSSSTAAFVLLCLATLAVGCASEAPRAPTPASLPRLRCEVVQPLRPSAQFTAGWGQVNCRGDHPPTPAPESPFPTDLEAERHLREWLRENFGPLPTDTELQVESVQHSASGGDRPRYDWDAGHTFVFVQTWRGIPTDRTAVLYLQGRSKVFGMLSLSRFTGIPGSDGPILGREAARARFEDVMRSIGGDTAEPMPDAMWQTMHLRYLYADGDESQCELRPVWGFGMNMGYLDAVTGAPGR